MDSDSEDEEIHHIDIHFDDGKGFGFRIRGGAEYTAPLCVWTTVQGGAADKDNRLRVSIGILFNGHLLYMSELLDKVNVEQCGVSMREVVMRRQRNVAALILSISSPLSVDVPQAWSHF